MKLYILVNQAFIRPGVICNEDVDDNLTNQILKFNSMSYFQTVNSILHPTVDTSTLAH